MNMKIVWSLIKNWNCIWQTFTSHLKNYPPAIIDFCFIKIIIEDGQSRLKHQFEIVFNLRRVQEKKRKLFLINNWTWKKLFTKISRPKKQFGKMLAQCLLLEFRFPGPSMLTLGSCKRLPFFLIAYAFVRNPRVDLGGGCRGCVSLLCYICF